MRDRTCEHRGMRDGTSSPDAAAARAFLERAPFRHIMLLKYWQAFAADTEVRYLRDGAAEGVRLMVATAASAYDRATYPQTAQICFLRAETPALARALLADLPRHGATIFKLVDPVDVAAVQEALPVQRQTAFVSFTAPDDPVARPARADVISASTPADDALPLYRSQGYEPDEVADYAANRAGRFYAVREPDGRLLGACFSFRNWGQIHEIGGLHTLPAARRRGIARRLVETALAVLQSAGEIPRYQVHEDNAASIALAAAVGLVHGVTAEHWLHVP